MKITSKHLHGSILQGAYEVIKNKDILNSINIFPVQDGDTGSNLASMMRTIIHTSETKATVKDTLTSVSEAALLGARGNSGIIFAQYLTGLSESIVNKESVTVEEYAEASQKAVKYAYEAIEEPVEGTIITVMKEWGRALVDASLTETSVADVFGQAYKSIELALERTKDQMAMLKKANVVDSGAKGFTCFIEGVYYYVKNDGTVPMDVEPLDEPLTLESRLGEHVTLDEFRYCTECLIEGEAIDKTAIKAYLHGLGNSIVIAGNKTKCRVHLHTNKPSFVFDYLHSKGTVIFQKIDDMYKQEQVVNHRKSTIAIVTDSIADLPSTYVDDHQVHVIHLDVLFNNIIYMDKLTVYPKQLLEISRGDAKLPTSSQPSPKQIENLIDYLSSYYDSAIVLTVSKHLSGTYNSICNSVRTSKNKNFKVSVINTKQNSGAEGLMVMTCTELVEKGLSHEAIVDEVNKQIPKSKILVQVKNLDNMIKSGRLNVKTGKIAQKLGLKPVVSLDDEGKGAIEGIAFSDKGSTKKLVAHIRKVLKTDKIKTYNIVHVNNLSGAESLYQTMLQEIGFEAAYISETSSIVAIGAGEGAVALSYLLE